MLLTTKSILCLSIFAILSCVKSDDCGVSSLSTLSLCQEFQALLNLAPHASVISIMQIHMQNDIRFRKAVQFMLSPLFVKTTQEIDATTVYTNILTQFTNAGVNTTDIDGIAKIFNCLIIPLIQDYYTYQTADVRSVDVAVAMQSRSLDTVLGEINNLIPRAALVNTLTTHLANNTQFASFYKVVRQPSFQSLVLTGFKSSEVARQIKILRRNQIDLCQMVQYAFNIFALGPQPK